MAGRCHDVSMNFLNAQSSSPVSVTVYPAEEAPFTVHRSELPCSSRDCGCGCDCGLRCDCGFGASTPSQRKHTQKLCCIFPPKK
eukprot:285399-Chlamydomonas_euryale.AAC.1